VHERTVRPVREALAGRMAMLAHAGRLEVTDPIRAARQFVVLVGAELPELTALGTRRISAEAFETAVCGGVDTFLLAYAPVPAVSS